MQDSVLPGSANASRRPLSPEKVYAFYEALYSTRSGIAGELGGSLLLYESLDEAGSIAALAANIAGVATLGIDSNHAALKQGVRDGICDFLVNSLDESLRILKNEIRKKQPVSVCLQQEFASAMAEIIDRGVQPDFLAMSGENSNAASAVEVLCSRGATIVPRLPPAPELAGVTWIALAAPAFWLPKIDAIASSIIRQEDQQRQRWLRFAARYLGRLTDGAHFLPMTAEEAADFRLRLQDKIGDGSIGCAVRIMMEGSVTEMKNKV